MVIWYEFYDRCFMEEVSNMKVYVLWRRSYCDGDSIVDIYTDYDKVWEDMINIYNNDWKYEIEEWDSK